MYFNEFIIHYIQFTTLKTYVITINDKYHNTVQFLLVFDNKNNNKQKRNDYEM